MRLAFVSDFFVPHYTGGGEVRYYEILKELKKKGYEIDLYCMRIKDVKDYENIEGITVYHIGPKIESPPIRSFFQMIRFSLVVAMKLIRTKKYDHYEAQGVGIVSLFLVSLFKKINKTYVIHDLSSGKKDQWMKGSAFSEIFEKIIYKLPHQKIITVSDNMKERLIKELKIKKSDIYVIHNGVNHKLIDSVKIKNGKKTESVIFVGRLIPHKHVDDLIIAIKDIKDVTLKIVGSGPEEENLKKLVKELNLSRKVIFLGKLEEHVQVIEEIKKSKILVLPSTREGFGMVLIEAMYSGVPVISYDSDGAKEVIENNKSGILIKRDVKLLTEEIRNLLDDKEKYYNLVQNGRKRVEENFLWEMAIKELDRIYKKSLKN